MYWFKIVSIILCCCFTPFFYWSFRIYSQARRDKPDFDWPMADLTQFWITFATAFLIFSTKPLVNYVFYNICEPHAKDPQDPETHMARTYKMTEYIWSTAWFVFISWYGYFTLVDSKWLPWYLGGQGTFDDMFKDTPWNINHPGAIQYCLVEIGYHVGMTFHHAFFEKSNNYYEMMCHHLADSGLLISMLFSNYIGIGCVVVFLHDASDIFVGLIKIFVNSQHEYITMPIFFTLMVFWIWTRNLVFPWLVY